MALVSPTVVRADESATETVDESQFLARLEERDPRLKRLAAGVELARAEVVAAGVREDPVVALDREEVFPDGGVATNYARLTLPLDVSGRRGRRVAAARADVAAAAAEAEQARVEIEVGGLRVFYGAAYARLHVEAMRTEREALVRAVDVVRKRAGAGASSGYDLQRFELALLAYDDLLFTAETDLLQARAELAALLGEPGATIDAISDLSLPAHPAPLTGDGAAWSASRADLRAAKLRGERADHLAAEAARGWVPSLDVSAGVMSQDTGSETAVGYTVGLALSFPIFDRGRASRAQARALREAADAEIHIIEARVPALVRARRELLDRRITQAESLASTQLVRLDALIRAAETGYREGETGVVELLDAHDAARDLRQRHLELRRDARFAELDLWLALGRRP